MRFEDEELDFSIGFLLPKIHCLSTDRDYNPIRDITDISVVYKKVTIDDVSAFINTKETFMSLAELLGLGDNLKEFLNDIKTNTKKSKDLCGRVKTHIN